ncbi:MAG: glutamine synthetase III [Parachlamydiales bacterium]|nr:glutamine synthetase III [Parachlamydiales bacterium]
MNPRQEAVSLIGRRVSKKAEPKPKGLQSKRFGCRVFNFAVMQKALPKAVMKNIMNAMNGKEKLNPNYANTIAEAIKDWAISNGATHYCHWFQPLTGTSAEKHESFIDWKSPDNIIETFSGKHLIQGEPDASSFPNGGLRNTYEARGYTSWDPTSPVFLWKAAHGITLYIPSIFFSWTGDVLDAKIPLLRSDLKIAEATLRLLKLTGVKASMVYSTLGCEQEYFIIDRSLKNLRPDLVLLGRTVYGAAPSKGQELEDHYFGSVKDRVLHFMQDFEDSALELGIPVKTRHNEVAPAQHEIAPVFERSSMAVDHNLILMEIMRQVAVKHDLACLMHEKPFSRINGSGKHCNWSLATDTGINLLNPTDTPESSLTFLMILTAVLAAIHDHADLLRASAASASNDFRLGGQEAPPAIISVYLGSALEKLLCDIEKGIVHKSSAQQKFNVGIPVIPEFPKDNTDRNRTSPFAFTGNKFEYRAVGSSANCSMPLTVINAIVAEKMHLLINEIEDELKNEKIDEKRLAAVVMPILRKWLKASKDIRFSGDNYSDEWRQEAEKRGLPNTHSSPHAFGAIKSAKSIRVFQGILNEQELHSRYEIEMENYSKTMNIQVNLMVELFKTQILPAALKYQNDMSQSIKSAYEVHKGMVSNQAAMLQNLTTTIEQSIGSIYELEKENLAISHLPYEARGIAYCDHIFALCERVRCSIDHLETLVDDAIWPLPKYRELLFLL